MKSECGGWEQDNEHAMDSAVILPDPDKCLRGREATASKQPEFYMASRLHSSPSLPMNKHHRVWQAKHIHIASSIYGYKVVWVVFLFLSLCLLGLLAFKID